MTKKSKARHIIFYGFMIFAVFGIFILYLAYMMWRKRPVPNPPGDLYVIRAVVSPDYPDALYYDFELPQPSPVKLASIGRSGKYSLAAPGGNNHSPVVNIATGNWDAEHMKALALEGWIFTDTTGGGPDARLVISITGPMNDAIFTRIIPIHGNVKNKEWFRVSTGFKTDGYRYSSQDRVRVYLWNNGQQPVFMDDLTLFFGETKTPGGSPLTTLFPGEIYTAKPNTPPYPPVWFKKAEIGNGDVFGLAPPADSTWFKGNDPFDLLAGHFLQRPERPQEVILMKPGYIGVFSFESRLKKFIPKHFEIGGLTRNLVRESETFCADVDGDGFDELVLVPENSDSIVIVNPETNSTATAGLTLQWFPLTGKKGLHSFFTADLAGDGASELVGFGDQGRWNVFRFTAGHWESMAQAPNPDPKWDLSLNDIRVHVIAGAIYRAKSETICDQQGQEAAALQLPHTEVRRGKAGFYSCRRGKER